MSLKFTKSTGPRPSKVALQEASQLARPSTGDHMAIAMSMRPHGATQTEIINLLGKPHRNIIKTLLDKKQVKRIILPDDARAVRIKLIKK